MKSAFDPSFPDEQLTPEFWEAVRLDAMAEWLLRQMEVGRVPVVESGD